MRARAAKACARDRAAGTQLPGQRRPSPSGVLVALGWLGLLRWTVVTLLLVAGVRKVADLGDFQGALARMGFFDTDLIPLLAPLVASLEIGAAVCLALPALEFVGVAVTLFLSAGFAGLHGYLYYHGIVVPCGCAGLRETGAGQADHLLMSALCAGMFLGAALLTCFPPPRHRQARLTVAPQLADGPAPDG